MIFNKDSLPSKKNKFIVIDGINGAGKTTLIKHLEKFFINENENVITGKEPGGTQVGDELRKIVLESPQKLTPEAQFFIMSASRAEYVDKVILPTIAQKKFFISDRYYYSSLAFQSYAGGLNFEFVKTTSDTAIKKCYPDIVFILDLDLETAFRRLNIRNETYAEKDNFENEKLNFHQKVKNGFLDLPKKLTERFYIVDASKNEEQIKNEVISVLKSIYF